MAHPGREDLRKLASQSGHQRACTLGQRPRGQFPSIAVWRVLRFNTCPCYQSGPAPVRRVERCSPQTDRCGYRRRARVDRAGNAVGRLIDPLRAFAGGGRRPRRRRARRRTARTRGCAARELDERQLRRGGDGVGFRRRRPWDVAHELSAQKPLAHVRWSGPPDGPEANLVGSSARCLRGDRRG
jgi:hypothetical protein